MFYISFVPGYVDTDRPSTALTQRLDLPIKRPVSPYPAFRENRGTLLDSNGFPCPPQRLPHCPSGHQEIANNLVEFTRTFPLRPVTAIGEDMQPRILKTVEQNEG